MVSLRVSVPGIRRLCGPLFAENRLLAQRTGFTANAVFAGAGAVSRFLLILCEFALHPAATLPTKVGDIRTLSERRLLVGTVTFF